MRRSLCCFTLLLPLSAQACPDLQTFYDYGQDTQSQAALERALAPLMSECLRSSEYFALYGAAQMQSGKLAEALETLERALLLDPDNGAALIDYAQALYLRGQLFSALDLNTQLRAREDLPANIQALVAQRHERWRRDTRRHGFHADVLAGYDNNLNGAPDPSQITLTISGEPVILTLNPEYQAISGAYLNLGLGGQMQQLGADHQHTVTAGLRGRVSRDTASDLVQLESRYNYLRPSREHAWQFGAGLSHLFFGGSALYTGIDGSARYQKVLAGGCTRSLNVAGQYQLYNGQSTLNSFESKLSAGLDCPIDMLGKSGLVTAELGAIANTARNTGRPGGDRHGWQFNLLYQTPLYKGTVSSHVSHTRLDDKKGYSDLLDKGAQRWVQRSFVLLQYRQMLAPNMAFLLNAYHQQQRSNIELFDTIDSTLEIGISASF